MTYLSQPPKCQSPPPHNTKAFHPLLLRRDNSSQKDCEKLYRNDWFLVSSSQHAILGWRC